MFRCAFDIDIDINIERCACGGLLKIIAAIEDPGVIVRFLTHPLFWAPYVLVGDGGRRSAQPVRGIMALVRHQSCEGCTNMRNHA
jgi:hypothetical protein